jgi:hypothetical protein
MVPVLSEVEVFRGRHLSSSALLLASIKETPRFSAGHISFGFYRLFVAPE